MQTIKFFNVYFKERLTKENTISKDRFVIGFNFIVFLLFFFTLLFSSKWFIEDYLENPTSYKSVIYSGNVVLILSAILVYASLGMRELTLIRNNKEQHDLHNLDVRRVNRYLFFFLRLFLKVCLISCLLLLPLYYTLIKLNSFEWLTIISFFTYCTIVSAFAFSINMVLKHVKTLILFPSLILLLTCSFISIACIHYELTSIYLIFKRISYFFLFLTGTLPLPNLILFLFHSYLLVILCLFAPKTNEHNFSNLMKIKQ
ncbi:MAG: hypothetical protein ACI35O_12560 [Bacillaceae bacterium]